MYPWISKHLLYLPTQALRREPVLRHLRELEESQWWSPEEIRRDQDRRVRDLVIHAARHVPHYREAFRDVDAASFRGLDDLARLPILEKPEARAADRELVSEIADTRIDARKTSGSTGVPMPIHKSRDTIGRIRAIWYRYSRWYGIDMGDRQGRFLGHPVDRWGEFREDVQDFILNKKRLDPVYLTPTRMRAYWRRIRNKGLDYLYGYPSAMVAFARFLEQEGEDPTRSGVRALFCTGETLYPFQRAVLEKSFGVPVVNEWGCTESGVLAFPCQEHGRLHLSSDNVLVELLVGDRPAAPGEVGEVVISDLHSSDAPLIRYRLGDMAVAGDGSACPCGRGLPTIDRVEGRTSQMFTLPDGRQVHSEVFAYVSDSISALDPAVEGFRVCARGPAHFGVQVAGEGLRPDTLRTAAETLVRVLGDHVEIDVEAVSELPRDASGKLRYFVPEGSPAAEGSPEPLG